MDSNIEHSRSTEPHISTDVITSPNRADLTSENQLDPIEIQSSLTLLKLGLKTNLRWLDRDTPDVSAAIDTVHRLLDEISRLESSIATRLA